MPEDLKKPELTAQWEMKLSAIAKGDLKRDAFMEEIRDYCKELLGQIKTGEGQFRHDNLTNTKCPVCGKRMLSVKGKNSRCWFARIGPAVTERLSPGPPMPAALYAIKKWKLRGKGEGQIFVCSCGHKEKLSAFKDRRKKEGAGSIQKGCGRYLNQQKKEETEPLNNAFAAALAGLKVDP